MLILLALAELTVELVSILILDSFMCLFTIQSGIVIFGGIVVVHLLFEVEVWAQAKPIEQMTALEPVVMIVIGVVQIAMVV